MTIEPTNIELEEIDANEVSEQSHENTDNTLNGIDLIKHIDVDIKVNVGNAKVSVDELYSLTKGKVLTLEQTVDQPLTLLVNDKAVAKASLVAVGDHFGVQIVDILNNESSD